MITSATNTGFLWFMVLHETVSRLVGSIVLKITQKLYLFLICVTDQPRKLAFHEPRPCSICGRMYRDAATLRTHTAIMHTEGKEAFVCSCGEAFRTKYEMYMHKKNGHRPTL